MQILLVEDDLQLGAALAQSLQQVQFETVWVRRLAEARARTLLQPAAVILDINLPDGEGFTLLNELRQAGRPIPVLVMTARDALADRLRGLEGGADDYLVKPFAVTELIARLRAVLRRTAGYASDRWAIGDLVVDIARHEVSIAAVPVQLTPTEYRLLLELARASGRVVTRTALIERLWSSAEQGSEAALEVQVHGLRKKLGATRIRTVRGSGYALETT
jgi:two-component system, OmpR family, response regulator QseB